MSLKRSILGIIAASAIGAGGAAASAAEPGPASDLEHYFRVRTALAGDTIEGVRDHAAELAKSSDPAVAKAAQALAKADGIAPARTAFGPLSKAMIAEVDSAAKKGAALPAVYVFHCPMARPIGDWLQETDETGNPYYGAKMLKCGKLVRQIGGEKKGAYYCPMHPKVERAEAGKCPICGMPLKKREASEEEEAPKAPGGAGGRCPH